MSLTFRGPGKVPLSFRVNGRDGQVLVEPRRTLLSVLREELGLTGAKHGCGQGTCGACTVILDGQTVYACLTLAIDCEGREVRTVEGLARRRGRCIRCRRPFIEHDGYQCGFCTPGQIMSAVALLEANPQPTEEEVRREMAGNLCRCGAYPNILRAVLAAAEGGLSDADDQKDQGRVRGPHRRARGDRRGGARAAVGRRSRGCAWWAEPTPRVDGVARVTGRAALYPRHAVAGDAHGPLPALAAPPCARACASIATRAEAMPGVWLVWHRDQPPPIAQHGGARRLYGGAGLRGRRGGLCGRR